MLYSKSSIFSRKVLILESMRKSKSGFTLVELIIVMVIIAILATITAVGYNGVQAKARDTDRKNDLTDIAEAIQLYRQKYGSDVQTGSGCGSGGNGSGWFNYSGSTYPASILSCLQTAGYLDNTSGFVDPSGCTTNGNNAAGSPVGYCHSIGGKYGYTYMKYSSGTPPNQISCLYARMETSDDSSTLTSSSNPCYGTSSSYAASLGMNYELLVK